MGAAPPRTGVWSPVRAMPASTPDQARLLAEHDGVVPPPDTRWPGDTRSARGAGNSVAYRTEESRPCAKVWHSSSPTLRTMPQWSRAGLEPWSVRAACAKYQRGAWEPKRLRLRAVRRRPPNSPLRPTHRAAPEHHRPLDRPPTSHDQRPAAAARTRQLNPPLDPDDSSTRPMEPTPPSDLGRSTTPRRHNRAPAPLVAAGSTSRTTHERSLG